MKNKPSLIMKEETRAGVLDPEVAEGLFSFVACSKQNHTVFYQVIVWEISGFIGHDSADVIMSELSFPSVLFCSCHCMLCLLEARGEWPLQRHSHKPLISHRSLLSQRPLWTESCSITRLCPLLGLSRWSPSTLVEWKELRIRGLSDLASVSSCWWSLTRGHPCYS